MKFLYVSTSRAAMMELVPWCGRVLAVLWWCWFIGVLGAEENPPSPDEERERARFLASAEEVSRQWVKSNQERTVRFRVVDMAGNPIPDIGITVTAKRYRAVTLIQGKYFDVINKTIHTGADGTAVFGPEVAGDLYTSISADRLPSGFDVDQLEVYVLPDDNKHVLNRGPRTAPGIDFLFYLHRYRGPHPLWESSGKMHHMPLDGTPVDWCLTNPYNPERDARVPVAQGPDATQPDFSVRYWRDPAKPVVVPAKPDFDGSVQTFRDGTPYVYFNNDAVHWFEVTALVGGLRAVDPPDADPARVGEAPVDGYQQRVHWTFNPDDVRDPASGTVATSMAPRSLWYWWARGSDKGTVYALVRFSPSQGVDYTEKGPVVTLEARYFLNPVPNDRLIERPIRRKATWITYSTSAQEIAWHREINPTKPLPITAIPALLPQWPPTPAAP
jgi:hypothetical protein